jgi:hypothetical protein
VTGFAGSLRIIQNPVVELYEIGPNGMISIGSMLGVSPGQRSLLVILMGYHTNIDISQKETVALLSYYGPDAVADAGACSACSACIDLPLE